MICVDCLPLEGEGPVHRVDVGDARKAAKLMIARMGEGVRVRLVDRPRILGMGRNRGTGYMEDATLYFCDWSWREPSVMGVWSR